MSFPPHGGPLQPPRPPLILTLSDRLLMATKQPIDLEGLAQPKRRGAAWRRQVATASYALDLLGAALRAIAGLKPPATHGSRCVDVQEVFKLLGDPPTKENRL